MGEAQAKSNRSVAVPQWCCLFALAIVTAFRNFSIDRWLRYKRHVIYQVKESLGGSPAGLAALHVLNAARHTLNGARVDLQVTNGQPYRDRAYPAANASQRSLLRGLFEQLRLDTPEHCGPSIVEDADDVNPC